MKLIVDRFEENYVVCENEEEEIINLPMSKITFDIQEGDVLEIDDDGIVMLDLEATMQRKEKIERLIKDIWEN